MSSDTLPVEVVLHIFGYLDIADLIHAGLACRAWWSVSLEPSLWRSLFLEAKREARRERLREQGIYSLHKGLGHDSDEGDEDWKGKYQSTFHIRRTWRSSLADSAQLSVCLDQSRFVAGQPNNLSGEAILSVGASKVTTQGIFVRFHAYERRFVPHEKTGNVLVLWDIYHPVIQDCLWDKRRSATFLQGTHRFRFSIPFPKTMIPPSTARVNGNSVRYEVVYGVQACIAYSWPFRDHWLHSLPFVTSVYTAPPYYHLTVVPSPQMRALVMREWRSHRNVEVNKTALMGSIQFKLFLPRAGFFFGEKIRMRLEVQNNSLWDYTQITVRPLELMRRAGSRGNFDPVEPPTKPTVTVTATHPTRPASQQQQEEEEEEETAPGSDREEEEEPKLATDGGQVPQQSEKEEEEEEVEEVYHPLPARTMDKNGRGEQVFNVSIGKNSTRRFVLEFVVEADHLNPEPWNMPYLRSFTQAHTLAVTLRNPSMWLAKSVRTLSNLVAFDFSFGEE